MIKQKTLYSLRDISIIPQISTDIESRSQCNPFAPSIEGKYNDFLPLIAAPMSCVYSDGKTYNDFWNVGINCVIPRTVDTKERLELMETVFCAFSMKEATDILELPVPSKSTKYYVLIDMANGHMKKELEIGKNLKSKFGTSIVLMGGNIANPETYLLYEKAGFDFVRVGIGGGCFVPGQKVILEGNELKPIENICIGDLVKTHDGTYQKVINIHEYDRDEDLYEINDIKCTKNHEFYVINAKDEGFVNENNIGDYAFWVSAEELDPDKHLLIKL